MLLQLSFFDCFWLCSYSFKFSELFSYAATVFFPELILHKYSVEGFPGMQFVRPLAGRVTVGTHTGRIFSPRHWRDIQSRECSCFHRTDKLFLSVCADDINMVNRKRRLAAMCAGLRKKIDLEDPTPVVDQSIFGMHPNSSHS